MSQSVGQTDEQEFHPDFKRTGAADEIVLVSKDNTLFAVPLSALARVSPSFSTMARIPQPATDALPVAIPHSAETVRYIAAYACGMRHPELTSVEQIDGILRAADMYEMAGLLSVMHLALYSVHTAVKMSPARRYVMARRYGWENVRTEAEAVCLERFIDMDVPDDDFLLLKPVLQAQFHKIQTQLSSVEAQLAIARNPTPVPVIPSHIRSKYVM